MPADKRISSGGHWEEVIGYSRAVVAGPYIHVSGSTATVDGVLQHEGDAYAQAKVSLEIIALALSEGGHSLSDVVRTRIYLAHSKDMEEVGRAHGEVFGSIRPATTILAGLEFVNPKVLVEIEADSYKA